MKWLALIVVVVLAEGLNGQRNGRNQEENHQEPISKLKIDRTLIVEEYVDGAETFPPPTIEHGDFGGEQFKKDFDRVGAHWGQEINDVIYNQGIATGHNLIGAVEDRYNNLVNSVGQRSKKDSGKNNADKHLQYLVNQLKTLLDLKPGNQKIEHKPLRELPKIPTKIISQTKNRTASDFFLHLPEFFDEDMSSIYGYVTGIYLRGWYNTRKYFDIQQTEYRNQILNGWVLPAYRKVVEKVFKNRDHIEKSVNQNSWESFVNYGNQIIEISNEWLETLASLKQYQESG